MVFPSSGGVRGGQDGETATLFIVASPDTILKIKQQI
jgi:hypothetical protein